MFCMLLSNFADYVFLSLCVCKNSYCYECSVLCIQFRCVVLCIVCMKMCTALLPPGVNSIAVNKCIISYFVLIMVAYYLEGFQCLAVPSSESPPSRYYPWVRLHIQHSAMIAGTWAARRDVKPGTTQVESLRTVQWPAGNETVLQVKVHFVL